MDCKANAFTPRFSCQQHHSHFLEFNHSLDYLHICMALSHTQQPHKALIYWCAVMTFVSLLEKWKSSVLLVSWPLGLEKKSTIMVLYHSPEDDLKQLSVFLFGWLWLCAKTCVAPLPKAPPKFGFGMPSCFRGQAILKWRHFGKFQLWLSS